MKLKLLQSISGVGWSLNVGDTGEFENDEAQRLIDAGIAQPSVATEDRAVAPAPEKRGKK